MDLIGIGDSVPFDVIRDFVAFGTAVVDDLRMGFVSRQGSDAEVLLTFHSENGNERSKKE